MLHATSVALDPARGLLLLGQSGAGKSGLALELIALGARLVADDRCEVFMDAGALVARYPSNADPALRGVIEARGLGLLNSPAMEHAVIRLVVDLDQTETHRLPPAREIECCGCKLPLAHGVKAPHFGPALIQYLKEGRYA